MPDYIGVLHVGSAPGPASPPGVELMIGDLTLYQLLRQFEGRKVCLTLAVLDGDTAPRVNQPRTIRDLTIPR